MLFADIETSSGDPQLDSLNPWHHCSIAGIAITADDMGDVWYVPHDVLTTAEGKQWAADTFSPQRTWANHNVKYDAQVLANQLGIVFKGRMICTIVAAKMVDSDRWTFALDSLASDWLGIHKATSLLTPYLKKPNGHWKCKDYGAVPMDVLGDYACEDVNINRRLFNIIEKKMPAESFKLYELEHDVTGSLFRMERHGMKLLPQIKIKEEMWLVGTRLYEIGEELEKLIGGKFEPHVNSDCQEILTNRYGFPVLAYTPADKGRKLFPSYDKHVLKLYQATGRHPELIKLCIEWRELWIYNNLFLKTYLKLAIDDTLHPTYNQTVRTGRMSCGQPNMQQLNKRAKRLIVPRQGYRFYSTDAKQIEFRLIVHYIQNAYALQQYRNDPDTDYHSWVAEMIGIPRSPAKTMNFMLGYGGGKKQTVLRLQHQDELMHDLHEQASSDAEFNMLCVAKANEVYANYHEAMPELKQVSNRAAMVCRQRGYVRNMYGRQRRLPRKAAHKAFNTICQSTAADIVKESVVRVEHKLADLGARMVAVVHDEILLEVPDSTPDAEVQNTIQPVLESPTAKLRVPIRWSAGWSRQNWENCE